MASSTILSIQGYRGEPVPNQFLRPQGAIDCLAILLPGIGYTLDMPLFYYAQHLLLERNCDVLRVEYAYNQRPEFRDLPAGKRAQWLVADVTAANQAGLAQSDYERVVLIGKSLGTLAMGHLLTMEERPAMDIRAVWLTPLIGMGRLREQIGRFGGPSFFVIGTADPHYDPAVLEDLRAATNGEAVVVDGADHGMDVPGDPVASVRAVERVVAALARFL
jgi:predicted alpha/beta-hydrolase family hydrolase